LGKITVEDNLYKFFKYQSPYYKKDKYTFDCLPWNPIGNMAITVSDVKVEGFRGHGELSLHRTSIKDHKSVKQSSLSSEIKKNFIRYVFFKLEEELRSW